MKKYKDPNINLITSLENGGLSRQEWAHNTKNYIDIGNDTT